MGELFLVALRVGVEGGIVAALGWTLLRGSRLLRLAWPFAGAVAVGLVAGVLTLALGQARGLTVNDLAPTLHRAGHLGALAATALALAARGRSADDLAVGWRRIAAEVAALGVGLVVLFPEGAFLAEVVQEGGTLREHGGAAWATAAAALGTAAAIATLAAWSWRRARVERWLSPSSVLALVVALELAGVGARAVGAHTLPLAVTAVVSRAVHDAVHLVFVMLQVPDHAFLEDSVYQLILEFLEPALHAALAIVVVSAPLAAAWRAFARRGAPALPPDARAPERRAAVAGFRGATRRGAAPFALALALSAAALWSARADGEALYEPVPEPVVDDGNGSVIVPLGGPLGGADDRMRKWVYSAGGRAVTFFTIRRPDGQFAAALDLCEICQPKGYAQMGRGYVFCKYCKTPIPAVTVGQAGGCNPIPIPGATVKGSIMLVPRDALVAGFERGMAKR